MAVSVKQRSNQQNKALHKFFTNLADELNAAGYDMKRTLKESVDIPWQASTVKDFLWRPIQSAQLQKESTTELTTREIDVVYETLNKHLGEKLGIHVPFPSVDEQIMEDRGWSRKPAKSHTEN